MNPRLSFYSFEKNCEMIIHLPPAITGAFLTITLKLEGRNLTTWNGIPKAGLLRIPFPFDMPPSNYTIDAEITTRSGKKYSAGAVLNILPYKENEVKTDRLTGSLIVNRRIFFPFGFYCYSPVQPELPEEEVVKGFNMISPYQKIIPATIGERKAYMDRCAELGMKVHYNLLTFSGSGTASDVLKGIPDEKKEELLKDEIKAFMNHPALLAWYIADEPNGFKTPPEKLEKIYRIVKETDPWHPVSMVFMAPFLSARKYAGSFDIVLADPYPVPNRPVSEISSVTSQLKKEFEGKKPLWIVPQAFGGGEWWSREPSAQEIRSMTYQAVVCGARGIQYFIRHGPNSFPKSTTMWNECGKMSLEIAEITPWLLSEEKAPGVVTGSKNILLTSCLLEGKVLIIAVNTANSPVRADFRVNGISGGPVKVIFENRSLTMSNGLFSDYLTAFGSQVYLFSSVSAINHEQPYRGNLIKDPGFEDFYSPGVPSSCYSWNEGDKGSTFFLDTREHLEGDHSLRLITPKENEGTRLRFYPVNISQGSSYIITIWSKAEPVTDGSRQVFPYFEIGLGDFGRKKFVPSGDWQQFVTSVTIPMDSIPSSRVNVILRLPGKGTAWFDMLQVFKAVEVRKCINPEFINYNE